MKSAPTCGFGRRVRVEEGLELGAEGLVFRPEGEPHARPNLTSMSGIVASAARRPYAVTGVPTPSSSDAANVANAAAGTTKRGWPGGYGVSC